MLAKFPFLAFNHENSSMTCEIELVWFNHTYLINGTRLKHTLVSLIEGGEVIEGGVFIPANFQ